jgi:hypothetical protein
MKSSDRSILLGLVILGLLAAFWFMLLSPKRDRASELEQQVADLQAEVSQQQQVADFAEEAEGDYAGNYERLIVLGKAAPADGDTPSFLAQLSALAEHAGTDFDSLIAGGEAPVAPPAPATSETTTDQNATPAQTGEAAAAPTAAVPATETSAALLPLGASVGPAGLGVLPYTLEFKGDFFSMADLLASLDKQVGTGKSVEVNGRLLTINGFSMTPAESGDLAVELLISSYVLPESQGLTAGATPAAPAATVPAATPTTTVPTATATSTP